MREILAIFATHSQFANICTRKIFATGTQMGALCGHPCCRTVVCHCFVTSSWNGMPAQRHELGDRTVVKQLSNKHRLASMRVRTEILQLWGSSLDEDRPSVAFFLWQWLWLNNLPRKREQSAIPSAVGVLRCACLSAQWRHNCHMGYSSLALTWDFLLLWAPHSLVNMVASDTQNRIHKSQPSFSTASTHSLYACTYLHVQW